MTPENNDFVKIIPWDNHLKDFVYGVMTEKDFDDKMHPLELKQVSIFKRLELVLTHSLDGGY